MQLQHDYWEYSKQGNNYIAEITGLSKKYGFRRRFLDLNYRGREKHFLLQDFVPGHLYEIVSANCVNRRRSHPIIKSIFECVSIGEDEILLREVFENEAEFRVLLLDSRKRLISCQTVSLGSLDKALVESRDVFRPAIRAHAKFIILVHNHPSGDPAPSKDDIELTVKLSLSGEILDIKVLDHIIIGFSDHVSLKDKELM